LEVNEKNIAICYLFKYGDEANKCELTDQRLAVVRKNKLYQFPLPEIRSIEINRRRLLIPIVFSGVFTPLIIVGFFKGFFHPVMALMFIISGIFTFYIGWLGQDVLTVKRISDYLDFPIKFPTENLLAFIEYTNNYIHKDPEEFRLLYVLKDISENSRWVLKEDLVDPPSELYTLRQLREYLLSEQKKSTYSIWEIDPLKTGTVITYKKSYEDNRLKPILNGKIKSQSFVRQYNVEDFLNMARNKID
jgi:hypothetical protein